MLLVREKSSKKSVPKNGLLLYMADDEMNCDVIKPTWTELKSLVIARNRLAMLLKTSSDLVFLNSLFKLFIMFIPIREIDV
jgi:hypothetical protein